MPADDIGNVDLRLRRPTARKLYAINQSPSLLNKATGTVNSYLDGIYVSNTGSTTGPWNKIADSTKLANSGSALKQSVGGKGYGPGVQAWYNQFLAGRPGERRPRLRRARGGLRDHRRRQHLDDPGPVLELLLPLLEHRPDAKNTCSRHDPLRPARRRPSARSTARAFVYVGNDGGVYSRPVNGTANARRARHRLDSP